MGVFLPWQKTSQRVFFPSQLRQGAASIPFALRCSPQPLRWASAPVFPHFFPFLHLSFRLGGCRLSGLARGRGHGCCRSEVFPQPPSLPRALRPTASPGLSPHSKAGRVASKLGEDKPWLSHQVPETGTSIPTSHIAGGRQLPSSPRAGTRLVGYRGLMGHPLAVAFFGRPGGP